jgi:hypothetical protein
VTLGGPTAPAWQRVCHVWPERFDHIQRLTRTEPRCTRKLLASIDLAAILHSGDDPIEARGGDPVADVMYCRDGPIELIEGRL